MDYRIFKLSFPAGVHFGSGSLESCEMQFCADSLFSAMCMEAVSEGQERLDQLINTVQKGELILSDLLPYQGDELYLPKPFLKFDNPDSSFDVSNRKRLKNLKYIPLSHLQDFVDGRMDVSKTQNPVFSVKEIKVSAAVRGQEETLPYRVGILRFLEDCGLYLIIGYTSTEIADLVEHLVTLLSYSGIGGKRASGLGRFRFKVCDVPEELSGRLTDEHQIYMTVSVSLPGDEEFDDAIPSARYSLIRRSGFVSSSVYAPEFRKKRDLYAFQAGACFEKKFKGVVADVSDGGTHPVYRYAKPMFVGVKK